MKVRGKGLSSLITGTDPLKDYKILAKCEPVDETDSAAILTANLVNALSDEIRRTLKNHKINVDRKE